MTKHIEYLNANLDIRIVNRKKRLMEALVSVSSKFSIKKGAIIGADTIMNTPISYQGVLGYVTHLIEFQDNFYIRAFFTEELEDSTFNLMNSGSMDHISIGFTPYLERQKHDVRMIFSMRIHSLYIHDPHQIVTLMPEMKMDQNIHALRNYAY